MGDVVAGRFELIDLLGSGGAGSVWRAWDHKQGVYLAAKVLKHSDSDSIMRFIREARTIIENDHVLVPRNWVGEDDRVLFTTDLVRGGSVAMLVAERGALPERWVLEIGRQTAMALASIHSQGFVHRDVKPANLLLEPTGRNRPHVWLADFGIATTQDAPRLTATHLVLGTPGYLCLEAYHGAVPAPSQDIWALGAVMRHLATGVTPPPAPERDAWRDAGTDWPLSSATGALVGAMLATDPSARPTAAQVVAHVDHLLASAPRDAGEIEVFDQIGLPPAGWGPGGPISGSHRGLAPTQPMAPVGPTGTAPSPASPGPASGGQGGPASGAQWAAPQSGSSGPASGTGDSRAFVGQASADGSRNRSLSTVGPLVLIALGIALVAFAVATW